MSQTYQPSGSETTEMKILANYMLSLVSKFSNDILEFVKTMMNTDKSDFLHNKMRHASMMEKYLKRFKDCMTDVEFVEHLTQESDPKLSHSIEKIYQVCVYDVFDDIERKVKDINEQPTKDTQGRLDIQIEFFTTFIRSFLKQVYGQMMTSKQFYFHRLDHKEQRQRIDLILKPLLSQMVHLRSISGSGSELVRSSSAHSTIPSSKSSSHGKEKVEKPKQKDEGKEEEEDDEDDDEDDESITSSMSGVSGVSSTVSKKSIASKTKVKSSKTQPVAKPIPSATKPPIPSVAKPPIQSAVILPEPIRSAKPLVQSEDPKDPKEPKDAKKESKKEEIIVNIEPKPESVKEVSVKKPAKIQSTKKIMTPMKLQSDTIHQTQRQIQSVIQSASKRTQDRQKVQSVKAIKSSAAVVV